MAEKVQITLFTFDELPEESQQKLIEGFRKDYDPFYDHIYDEFINDMSEKYGADVSSKPLDLLVSNARIGVNSLADDHA